MSSTRHQAREGSRGGSVTSPEDKSNSLPKVNAKQHTSKKASRLSNYHRALTIIFSSSFAIFASAFHSFIKPSILSEDSDTPLKEDAQIGSGIATAFTFLFTGAWIATKHFFKSRQRSLNEIMDEVHYEAEKVKNQTNPWHRRMRTGYSLGSSYASGMAELLSITPITKNFKFILSGILGVAGGLIGGLLFVFGFESDPDEYNFVACRRKPTISALKQLNKKARESALFLYLENDQLKWSYTREEDGELKLISKNVVDDMNNNITKRYKKKLEEDNKKKNSLYHRIRQKLFGKDLIRVDYNDQKVIYKNIKVSNDTPGLVKENHFKENEAKLGNDGWSKYTKAGWALGLPFGAAIGAIIGTLLLPGIGTTIGASIGICAAVGSGVGGALGFAGFAGGVPLVNKIKRFFKGKAKSEKKNDTAPFRSSYLRFGVSMGAAIGVVTGFFLGPLLFAGLAAAAPLLGVLLGAGIMAIVGAIVYPLFIGPWLTKKFGDKSPSSVEYGGRSAQSIANTTTGGPLAKVLSKLKIGGSGDAFKEFIKAIIGIVGASIGYCYDLYHTIKNKDLDENKVNEIKGAVILPWSQRVPAFTSFGASLGAIIGFCVGLCLGPVGAMAGTIFGATVGAAAGGLLFTVIGAWKGDWILEKIDQFFMFLMKKISGAEPEIKIVEENDLETQSANDRDPPALNTGNINSSLKTNSTSSKEIPEMKSHTVEEISKRETPCSAPQASNARYACGMFSINDNQIKPTQIPAMPHALTQT